MKGLLAAIQFLTILPAGRQNDFEPGRMIPFFPVVGLIIGGLACLVDAAAGIVWDRETVSLLVVLFLVLITGGLHLDGLGDTADGLFSRKPMEQALVIMKDSRLGSMGVLVIFFCLALKWRGICGLEDSRWLYLAVIPALARASMIFGIRFLQYGRPDGGTGSPFFQQPVKISCFAWIMLPVGISMFIGWLALSLIIIFIGVVLGILMYYQRRAGVITGDMLGAMCEVTETVLFFTAISGGKL